MTVYFLDTSALARRYLQETGSEWVRGWIISATRTEIILSALAIVEMESLLARRRHEETLLEKDYISLRDTFRSHIKTQYTLISLTETILEQAANMATKYPLLRTLDSIQLACALVAAQIQAEPLVFVCADNRLLNAAVAEGFSIDNPNIHP